MQESMVLQARFEVAEKLSKFNVTKDELQSVALAAAAARNNATPLHPINSSGTYSYHEGVAALRMVFLSKDGWRMARPNGIEVVENQSLGLTIIFQNVDNACGRQDPKPLSDKGEGSKRFVENPSGYLWSYMEDEDRQGENQHVWFYCVSVNGDDVRAELSRPSAIKGTQFGLFLERIFIIDGNDQGNGGDQGSDSSSSSSYEVDDFEISVTKK